MASGWVCAFDGTYVESGDYCPSCGHSRRESEQEAARKERDEDDD